MLFPKRTTIIAISSPLLLAACGDASVQNANVAQYSKNMDNQKAQPLGKAGPEPDYASNSSTKGRKDIMDNANSPSKFTLNSCATLQTNGAAKEVEIGEFLTDFPKELFDEKAVEAMILTDADITHITANLACAAALSGYGPDVPESALALFASKRYGKSAMAALKQQANGSTDAAKAARQFVNQMKSYLAGPSD